MSRPATRLALTVLTGLAACSPGQSPPPVRQVVPLRAAAAVVIEEPAGRLTTRSLQDGRVLWRYKPAFPPTPRHLDMRERYALSCDIAETTNGLLMLRYDSELHVIASRTGKLKWKKKARLWVPSGDGTMCPALTSDSGVVMLGRNGMLVHKFDSSGDLAWSYPLVGLGAAIRRPDVSPMSGDVVLLTRTHLLSLSPDGRLGWVTERKGQVP